MDRDNPDDDDKPSDKEGKYYEFDCPDCNAHNPVDDGFKIGGEALCYYCGTTFEVRASGSKYRLRAV